MHIDARRHRHEHSYTIAIVVFYELIATEALRTAVLRLL